MEKIYSAIKGTGSALPAKCLPNTEFLAEYNIDSNSEWIETRTGITQRYFCTGNESTSTLATQAATNAMKSANIDTKDIDLIIVATCTPDKTFPSVAMQVHGALACKPCPAFDVQVACSGFIYALNIADNFIKSGQAKNALVIGAEVFSKILDWEDRTTSVLFGDGAGAIVLQATQEKTGILGVEIGGDGQYGSLLETNGGTATTATAGHVTMHGREIFKHAVKKMGSINNKLLSKLGLKLEDINWLIPHQANKRIIESAAKFAGIDMQKVIVTVDIHANTSGASIPLALDFAIKSGKLKAGDMLYLQAFGAGFSWGDAIISL